MSDGVEGFYVAARVLEAVSRYNDGSAGEVAVYARAAARARKANDLGSVERAIGGMEDEASGDETEAVARLGAALREVREDGDADIVAEVDDGFVARLRSEYDS